MTESIKTDDLKSTLNTAVSRLRSKLDSLTQNRNEGNIDIGSIFEVQIEASNFSLLSDAASNLVQSMHNANMTACRALKG